MVILHHRRCVGLLKHDWCSRPCVTIASKIDHDVGLSVHDAREFERGDVAPHFEGPEERIVDDLLVEVRRVSQDPAGVESESESRVWHQNILSDPSDDYGIFGTWRQAVLNHQVKKKANQTLLYIGLCIPLLLTKTTKISERFSSLGGGRTFLKTDGGVMRADKTADVNIPSPPQ